MSAAAVSFGFAGTEAALMSRQVTSQVVPLSSDLKHPGDSGQSDAEPGVPAVPGHPGEHGAAG